MKMMEGFLVVAFILWMVRRKGPSMLADTNSDFFLDVDSQPMKKFMDFAGSLGFLWPFNLVTCTCIKAQSNEFIMDGLEVNMFTKSHRNGSVLFVTTTHVEVFDD